VTPPSSLSAAQALDESSISSYDVTTIVVGGGSDGADLVVDAQVGSITLVSVNHYSVLSIITRFCQSLLASVNHYSVLSIITRLCHSFFIPYFGFFFLRS
jgi:hypothetical protein